MGQSDLFFVAPACALDHLHVKRAVMVWTTSLADRPLARTVTVLVTFAEKGQHPLRRDQKHDLCFASELDIEQLRCIDRALAHALHSCDRQVVWPYGRHDAPLRHSNRVQ